MVYLENCTTVHSQNNLVIDEGVFEGKRCKLVIKRDDQVNMEIKDGPNSLQFFYGQNERMRKIILITIAN